MKILTEDTLQLTQIPVPGYHKVFRVEDPAVGLLGIICIHNLTLGPALGGIRLYPYPNFDAALLDVMRLSQAMTYKAALAGCSLGGGKSVIIASNEQKTEELLLSFGRAIELLEGMYIGAEDVGISPKDVLTISKATKYVTGLPHAKSSGNPSAFTAWGVFRGIQAVLQMVYGSDSVRGRTIAIQGVGSVGSFLADMLFWNGAKLILSDVAQERAQELARRYGAVYSDPQDILSSECDVLAPCALGGVINPNTIDKLRCKAVAGAANNQLLSLADGEALRSKGIWYAPDFIINSGGLLNVADEIMPDGYHAERVREKIHKIYDQLLSIFKLSEEEQCSTCVAAQKLGDLRLESKEGAHQEAPVFHHAL